MRLLVASATSFELAAFRDYLEQDFGRHGADIYQKGNLEIRCCVTGIGAMQTAYHLSEAIADFKPHFCLQAGVAGSFDRELLPGQLVIVQEEVLGDLGVEDHDNFLDMFEVGLIRPNEAPFTNKKLVNPFHDFPIRLNLPFVSSLTVNMVSGCEDTIRSRAARYGCTIESMEGAAFHYVCLHKNIPFLQVRSISNYVEPRDKSKWKMAEAISSLNEWLKNSLPA